MRRASAVPPRRDVQCGRKARITCVIALIISLHLELAIPVAGVGTAIWA
jgi:hypothetical protein